MQIPIGTDEASDEEVVLDTTLVVNPHVQICGVTGMGKTHRIKDMAMSLIRSAASMRKPVRIHVFDPHGDIQMEQWCSEVKFSESTQYGYNPLEINPDPDVGGVNRAIQKFITAVKKHKTLGTKQEAVMRYVLEDLYASRGYRADRPATWRPDDPRVVHRVMSARQGRVYLDVPVDQWSHFKEVLRQHSHGKFIGGFDEFDGDPEMRARRGWWVSQDQYDGEFLLWEPRVLFKAAPTLDDAVRFTERKLKAMLCSTSAAAVTLLGDIGRAARNFRRSADELTKRGAVLEGEQRTALQGKLARAKAKYMSAAESYLDSIQSGVELDELIRYNSADVLTSVYERFQNLRGLGIYSSRPPPFDPGLPIWRYHIKHLEIPVQQMFVDMVCARVFDRALQRGLQDDVVEVLLLDEGKRYNTEENGNVLDMIANEGRKFGLAIWICLQSPAQASDDLMKSTGTIVVVGLAKADTGVAARKLGIDNDLFQQITPNLTALVQIKNKGVLTPGFRLLRVT